VKDRRIERLYVSTMADIFRSKVYPPALLQRRKWVIKESRIVKKTYAFLGRIQPHYIEGVSLNA
jgi:hypothetical protein